MQAHAVEQLGFIGRHQLGQAALGLGVFISIGISSGTGHRLQHGHVLQHHGHVFQRGGGVQALQAQLLDGVHHLLTVAMGQGLDQAKHMAPVHRAQHLLHRFQRHLPSAKRHGLVGQAQSVAHGAAGRPGHQAQSGHVMLHPFGLQNMGQVLDQHRWRHGPQVELQATRQHGDRYFLGVGGGQHKFQVIRRLLQGLQHRIESGVGEHVHLVDHEHLETPLNRLVYRLFQQGLNLVHTPVGGRIEFGVVHKTPGINVATGIANPAGLGRDATLTVGALAIERLGQNARHRGFAHPPRAREQIGMVQALLGQGIDQGAHHMGLPHHLGEVFGAVFAGEHQVRHGGDSMTQPPP